MDTDIFCVTGFLSGLKPCTALTKSGPVIFILAKCQFVIFIVIYSKASYIVNERVFFVKKIEVSRERFF